MRQGRAGSHLLGGVDPNVADFGARWIKKEDVPLSAVRCYPDKRLTKRCRVIMDTIADGFALLAAHYPQYVSYKQTGGADNDA